MPIDDVIAETTDLRAVEREMAQGQPAANGQRTQSRQQAQARSRGSMPSEVRIEGATLQLGVEVAILVMLILIYMRL